MRPSENHTWAGFYLFIYLFSLIHGMQMFPGQASNLSHSSGIAKSLTTRPPGNSLN